MHILISTILLLDLGRPVPDRPRFSNSHLHCNLVEKLLMKEITQLCKK